MWSRGVRLDPERVAAWWAAMEPFLAEARQTLAANQLWVEGEDELRSLTPVSVAQIASLYGIDERVGTAVYTELEGSTRGLLMFSCELPATVALGLGAEVFAAFARGVGGQFEEPWALMDMRSTLAESLAAQTGSLELAVMISVEWPKATLCFVPDWAQWGARTQMELREEAA